jgi:beta-glucosidase
VFVKNAADLPFFDKDAIAITYDLWHGYRKLAHDGVAPAFPFGFGLSYTTFALSDLRLASDALTAGDDLRATVRVTNTGAVDGDEVVQMYIAVPESAVERAPFELKGFKRVTVRAGASLDVEIVVRGEDLAYYDEARGWTVEAGRYEAIVGNQSLDPRALRGEFTVGDE